MDSDLPGGESRDRLGSRPALAEAVAGLSMAELVVEARAASTALAAAQARQLVAVAELARRCAAQALAELAAGPRVDGQPDPAAVAASAATAEVAVVLGVSASAAESLSTLGRRLVGTLPDTLAALAAGRLDLTRARALVSATEALEEQAARSVEALMLADAGAAPWAGPAPRGWRERLARRVAAADPAAARRRRQAALAERSVRCWPEPDGMGVLQMRADAEDVAMADSVITDLARALPGHGPDGARLSMDQRRVDALLDLLRRVRDGDPLPGVAVRRERELGLVVHADTVLGDGPAADAPGERRGTGSHGWVDPATAREAARAVLDALAADDGAAPTGLSTRGVQVLLTDESGTLVRVVRLTAAPAEGWTRAGIAAAVRAAWPGPAGLTSDGYAPTAAIEAHVRARNPRCVGYDCARSARRCDLDHDTPWPRGPTSTDNLAPRCRCHHEHKTRRLVHTTLHPDGSCTTRHHPTGLVVTTRPEPLPGHAPGEGYQPLPGGTPRPTGDGGADGSSRAA